MRMPRDQFPYDGRRTGQASLINVGVAVGARARSRSRRPASRDTKPSLAGAGEKQITGASGAAVERQPVDLALARRGDLGEIRQQRGQLVCCGGVAV